MPLPSRSYWIQSGESAAATAQNIDHTVPASQAPVLQYLYVESSDGSNVGWTLERPAGTIVLRGFSPAFIDFGIDGFRVPGTPGDDLRLAIAAGAAGITTRGWTIGIDTSDG